MKNKLITVRTSKGMLRAEIKGENGGYPGIWIYMDDELVNVVELYEDDEVLKCHTYDTNNEEPLNSIILIDYNEEYDAEEIEEDSI